MKKLLTLAMLLVMSLSTYAQKDVTKFLGIPVDGTKSEMIRKLKDKGFTRVTQDASTLKGEFNGYDVYVTVVTDNNRVWRIMVTDAEPISATDIKIRFNKLCNQFENNPKYLTSNDYTIPQDEDIRYSKLLSQSRYEAMFYQRDENNDLTKPESLKKMVWFMISEYYGKYYISMYYDNLYNQSNGEDL